MAEKHVVVAGYDSPDYEVFIANEAPLLLTGLFSIDSKKYATLNLLQVRETSSLASLTALSKSRMSFLTTSVLRVPLRGQPIQGAQVLLAQSDG
jgi:hypothetical protein